MTIDTDVLVVGGGATGTGIARDLSLRGLEVTLTERGGLSAGTSSRSHGLLHSGARYAEADPAGAAECIEESSILKTIAGDCVRDTGGLFVQRPEDDPDYFEAKRAACEEIGIPTATLDGGAARAAVPGLAPDVERAMWVPDGAIYPSRLVAANAADAEDHGATILTHAPVEEMLVDDARVTGASVGGSVGDVIEADYVVNATGAWAERIGELTGTNVPMHPNRGVMVSVRYEGLEPVLNRCRIPSDGDIVVPHESEVILGTTSVDIDDPDEFETPEWEVEAVIAECSKLLPAVADAERLRTWWGVRPLYGPDEADRDGRGISRDFVLLDHADDPDGIGNLATIVGGKLTTYRGMAEAASDLVCDRLGVDAGCVTDRQRLPGADDPARLDAFVERFDSLGPTDESVVVHRVN